MSTPPPSPEVVRRAPAPSAAAAVVTHGSGPHGPWRILAHPGPREASCFHCQCGQREGTGGGQELTLVWDGPGAGEGALWLEREPLRFWASDVAWLTVLVHDGGLTVCVRRLDNATADPHVPGVASLLFEALRTLHPRAEVWHGRQSEQAERWWARHCRDRGLDPADPRS